MTDAEERPERLEYFIDEAGTPTLFGRRGKKIIVGTEGCSEFFILGKIRVADPDTLRTDLDDLRSRLISDPYFRDMPSMKPAAGKTAVMFHAKDDRPEVRREVFQLLVRHDIRFYAVVRNKRDLANFVLQRNLADPGYRFRENDVYHSLTRELFSRLRQTADELHLVFASRGSSTRNQALRDALRQADDDFGKKFGFRREHVVRIEAKGSREDPCLQACDYFPWALQRHFENRSPGSSKCSGAKSARSLTSTRNMARNAASSTARIARSSRRPRRQRIKKPVNTGSPGTHSGTTRHEAEFCSPTLSF